MNKGIEAKNNTHKHVSKIDEYIDRTLSGDEKIEDFGDIPESWKQKIREATAKQPTVDHIELKNVLYNTITRFKRPSSYDLALKKIESDDFIELYEFALNELYQDLRSAEYDRTDNRINYDIDMLTQEISTDIRRVQQQGGWHYRMPIESTSANKSIGRFSLNVVGNKDLVNQLDALTRKYRIYYKTPDQAESWNERNDPVTIYVNNPELSEEDISILKQEIADISEPYIRSNQGFGFYGDNYAPGIEYGPESTHEVIDQIKEKALKISPELYSAIETYLLRDGKPKSSVGQNIAAMRLIRLLEPENIE